MTWHDLIYHNKLWYDIHKMGWNGNLIIFVNVLEADSSESLTRWIIWCFWISDFLWKLENQKGASNWKFCCCDPSNLSGYSIMIMNNDGTLTLGARASRAMPLIWFSRNILASPPGPLFNIKMSPYQYRKSNCGDKMVVSFYPHNGISHTGKMASLYWTKATDGLR